MKNNKKYMPLNIQKFSEEIEAGTTIQINGSATLTDVDTSKESRVLRLLGQTSQNGTPTPSSPIPVNVVSGDNEINVVGKNLVNIANWVKGKINNTTGNIEYTDNVSSMVIGENNISFVVSQAWNSGIASDFIPISTGSYVFKYSHNREITMCIDTYDSQKTRIARIDAFTQVQTPTTRTFTISDSSVKYIRIHFEVNTANVEYIVSDMQLEKGSTATTYEPYIGNSYPIYLGVENLFDGVFRQGNRYTIGLSDTTRLFTTQNYPVKSGQTYTISTNLNVSAFKYAINLSIVEYPIENTTAGNAQQFYDSGWKQTSSFTFTPSQNGYLGIVVAKPNGTDSLTPSDISSYTWQLEKGSKANSYTPYGTTPIELCKIGNYQDYFGKSDGRNLFDKSTITTSAYLKEDGTLQTGTGAEYITSDFIPVKPNTTYYKTQTLSPRTKFYDKNKQVLDSSTYQDISIGGNAGSFTTPNNAYYFRFTGNVNASTGININTTMVNEGSSTLPYQPYGVGKWYKYGAVGKIVFTGASSDSYGVNANWDAQATNILHTFTNDVRNTWKIGQSGFLSNKFICTIESGRDFAQEMITCHTTNETPYFFISYDRLSEVSSSSTVEQKVNAFKQWLSSNNVTLYYILATPTITEITDTTLIEQLEALQST